MSLPSVTIVAHDGSFDAPQVFPAGLVQILFENEAADPAGAQIFQHNPGVSLDTINQALQTVRADPTTLLGLFTAVGGPQGVAPGTSEQLVIDLVPGNYLILNTLDHFSPSNAIATLFQQQMNSGFSGPPLPAQSFPTFYTLFQVEPSAEPARPEPVVDGEMTMYDFSYSLPVTIRAGQTTWKVTNTGTMLHEMAIAKVADGQHVDDLISFFQNTNVPKALPDIVSNFPNPALIDFPGISALSPGGVVYATFDFTPGTYIVTCFLRDTDTNLPHVALGMITEFTVTP